jgi:peptide/nickel transport system permease protein
VLGITLVGESLNDLADPRLRSRRAVDQPAGLTAATPLMPGEPLPSRLDGFDAPSMAVPGTQARGAYS